MAERTGPVEAEDSTGEQAIQAAYRRFIRHTQLCAECRTQGVDCEDAAELRQGWRAARLAVAAP